MPFAKVLVALDPATFRFPVTESAPRVEVAVPRASIVEVAIKAPTVVVPAIKARPFTDRASVGVVVAMPRRVVTDSIVVVALVVVALRITRLVIVEEAEFTIRPPVEFTVTRFVMVDVELFTRRAAPVIVC